MTEPEMRAVIAERVMGWTEVGLSNHVHTKRIWRGKKPDGEWSPVPDYFHDPAAAINLLYAVQTWKPQRWLQFEKERAAAARRRVPELRNYSDDALRGDKYFHHTDIAPAVVRVLEQEGEKDAD